MNSGKSIVQDERLNDFEPLDPPHVASDFNGGQKFLEENRAILSASVVSDLHWRELLEMRRFSIENPPPKPVPVLTIGKHVVSTRGNLTVVQAPPKSAKTGLLRGGMSACLDNDFTLPHLGLCSDGEPGLILHFDTEQSRWDHYWGVRRVLKNAWLDTEPPELHSFSVADLSIAERRAAFFGMMKELSKIGRLKAVFLDGYADLIHNVNDPMETDPYVAELHAAAIQCDTVIFGVIHENPSSAEGKTRGHLGSQLTRKAETNLRLEKDKTTGIFTVYSDQSRNCHLPKGQGPRFVWCDQAKDFVDVEPVGVAKRDAKMEGMKELAEDVFRDAKSRGMPRAAVLELIAKLDGLKEGGARHRFDAMRKAGILTQKGDGNWIFAP